MLIGVDAFAEDGTGQARAVIARKYECIAGATVQALGNDFFAALVACVGSGAQGIAALLLAGGANKFNAGVVTAHEWWAAGIKCNGLRSIQS